nr:MetaGeneMark_Unknown Function [uncultured bacterium]
MIAFSGRVEPSVLNQFSDQLQRERRALVRELSPHQVLLNILTDIAGIRDIVDHLEIEPRAWQRRLFEGGGCGLLPGTAPNQEPYGGTEDINLTTTG